MKKIIALIGNKGCGKSVVAFRLRAKFDYTRISLSDPIKEMIGTLPGVEYEHTFGSSKAEPIPKRGGVTSRHLMQTLGTEWGRNLIHPEFWIDIWETRIEHYDLVVVDDVRFLNEAEKIKKLGGRIIRVIRKTKEPEDTHASEQEHHNIIQDVILTNRFDNLNDLYTEVDKTVEALKW